MARLFREIGNSVVILGTLTLTWIAVGFLGGINTPDLIGCQSEISPCWWLRFGGSDRKVLLDEQ